MSVLPVGIGSSGIYVGDIQNSLRFRGAQYLSKTLATPTSQNVWTWSGWVKRGALGASAGVPLFSANSGVNYENIDFSTDAIYWVVRNNTGSIYKQIGTNALYRDPTSHIHVLIRKTSSLTVEIYVNGVQCSTTTGTAGSPTELLNSAISHRIGYNHFVTYYLDGYLSRVCFVDGTALTPSSFGYLNTEINEWVSKSQSACKSVVDAGGTNSFMLDFDTSSLGNDFSSKNNDWTSTGHSTTAGTTCDWPCKDVPGNSFATLNPIIPSAASITNGNLTSATTAVRGTQDALAYGSYWEVTAGGSAVTAGVVDATTNVNTTTVTANKTFGFRLTSAGALDYINITDAGSWTSITTGLTGNRYPYGVTQAATWNFGQIPLHASAVYVGAAGGYFYGTPVGKALCQANLPDPAILNPKKHFDIKTRTGTAATYSVTGIGFQPDFVWAKSRGRAVDHALYDSVRGVQKRLETNNTDAEVTGDTTGLTAFNSDGYTGGALDQINGTTATNSFVDWMWKAGGAAVTNNAGSIASQVSANTEAGFSVVTYTGNATDNATFGHGCMVGGIAATPGMVIIKARTATAAESWNVWHKSLTAETYFLRLNETAAVYTAFTNRQKSHASTTVTLGTNTEVNENTKTYVAYCFAEIPGYSKIGSYVGNGNADGPFVYCGFKPRYVMLKAATGGTGDWEVYDSTRETYNQMQNRLFPNSASAETGGSGIDFLSNGFKIRLGTGSNINTTSVGHIFAAFADVPAKFSNAR